jgi:DNA-binding MarR family transcriptional regulator
MERASDNPDRTETPANSLQTEDMWRIASATRRSITRMARCLRQLRSPHEVSGSKLSLLGRLFRAARPMTATDLAHIEHLQPQSLTRIIADLEEGGLIHRREDEKDRRQLLIEITPKGCDLLIQDAQRQNAWLVQMMTTQLTRAEREILRISSELLDQLADEDPEAGEELTARPSPG